MKSRAHSIFFNRCGSILPAVVLGILIVLAIVIAARPGVQGMKSADMRQECIENLVRLDIAKERYALAHQLKQGATVTLENLFEGVDNPTTRPICIAQGTYTLNPIGKLPVCSIPSHVVPVPTKNESEASK